MISALGVNIPTTHQTVPKPAINHSLIAALPEPNGLGIPDGKAMVILSLQNGNVKEVNHPEAEWH